MSLAVQLADVPSTPLRLVPLERKPRRRKGRPRLLVAPTRRIVIAYLEDRGQNFGDFDARLGYQPGAIASILIRDRYCLYALDRILVACGEIGSVVYGPVWFEV